MMSRAARGPVPSTGGVSPSTSARKAANGSSPSSSARRPTTPGGAAGGGAPAPVAAANAGTASRSNSVGGSSSAATNMRPPIAAVYVNDTASNYTNDANNNTNTNAGGASPSALPPRGASPYNSSSANNYNTTTATASEPRVPSFVELIKAREDQQLRIRAALEDQNDALQNRLRSALDNSNQRDATVNIAEFLTFVTDVKEMVVRGHEAEVAAFKALNDKVDEQQAATEQRLKEMEARLVASDRTRDLLREEQMGQTLALSNEVEGVKDTLERVEAHIAAHTEANEQTVVFSERVAAALQDFEDRVVVIETLPKTVRQTLVEMEMRVNEVQLDVQEDLRKIRERYPDTEDKLTHVMSKAEENLMLLQQHADAAIMAADHQQQRIEELIDTGITTLGRGLEGMLTAKYNEHVTRLTNDHEATKQQVNQQEQGILEAVGALKKQIDDYLSGLDRTHEESVANAMAALQHRAAAFEEERSKQYPIAEPARIEMMVKELDGAFAAVEGIVRAHMTGGVNLDHPYVKRIETLESQLAALAVANNDPDAGPKLFISTETQTGAAGTTPLPISALHTSMNFITSGPNATTTNATSATASAAPFIVGGDRYRSQLDDQVAIVGTEASAEEIAKAVDLIVARANSRPNSRPGTPTSRAARVATPSNTPREAHYQSVLAANNSAVYGGGMNTSAHGLHHSGVVGGGAYGADNSSSSYALAGNDSRHLNDSHNTMMAAASAPYSYSAGVGGGHGVSAAPGSSSSLHHNLNNNGPIDTYVLKEDISKKEAAVERIQNVLKEIAIKFKEITDKEKAAEARQQQLSGGGGGGDEATRQVAALLAKQKAAIYDKERQLIEKRNDLLREVKALRATLADVEGV